jgi:ATP-dependent helicase HrpB
VSEGLPIAEIRQRLAEALRTQRRFILSAPTGSGKSTQIPQYLLDDGFLGPKGQVIILQPRRVAARMLARRVAQERGGRPGDEVGHHIRLEKLAGPQTRILYVTEGLLVRRLLEDRSLPGVAAILFDEFHERHIDGDIGLACALEIQKTLRPDLILGVMSATLDIRFLEEILEPCAKVESAGRFFPVEIRYSGAPEAKRGLRPLSVPEQAARALARLTREGHDGDALIFMPGAAEIYQTLRALEPLPELHGAHFLPLHGELAAEDQDKAFGSGGARKIIVATNVAETSLTIPGVTVVVDSGLARIPDYDPRRDLNTLFVRPISQASADQRAGRAGRTAPGLCLRLWGAREHLLRPPATAPEILRLDLAETLLALKKFGFADGRRFPWIERPPEANLQRAENVLKTLGALHADGSLSADGEMMARFPVSPRHSKFFIAAAAEGCLEEALLVAALSQGRSIVLPTNEKAIENAREKLLQLDEHPPISDHAVELRAFAALQEQNFSTPFARTHGLHSEAARQALLLARQFAGICRGKLSGRPKDSPKPRPEPEKSISGTLAGHPEAALNRALLAAYNDRLAVRLDRGTLRCALIHDRRGVRRRESIVSQALFLSTEIEERDLKGQAQTLLGMNAAVDEAWLREFYPEDFRTTAEVSYDPQLKRVLQKTATCFRDLTLHLEESWEVPTDAAAELLAAEIAAGRIPVKSWDASVEAWILRVNFIARYWPEFEIPPIGPEERSILLEQFCHGASSAKELSGKDVWPVMLSWLSPAQLPLLDQYAPEKWTLPSGFAARLRYEADGTVVLRATIQKLYDAPLQVLVGGRVAARLEILAPNQRPVHITDSLAGFWEGPYLEIRKQLRGRYPKHHWR